MTYGTEGNDLYAACVNGGDVVDHFARGIKLATKPYGSVIFDEKNYALGLWESISAHMDLVSGVSFLSPVPDRTAKIPNKFIEEMRGAAYELWWPSLQTLRDTDESSYSHEGNPCGGLYDIWYEFGIALGLDEDEERAVHNGSKRRSSLEAQVVVLPQVERGESEDLSGLE
ncbi:hypothetical protein PENSPDRAFT_330151 [Peniophora sp. CONT]|nr:hypothetical protein PENSPDRAFT_330151 [Peniophora sp. CONT]